MAVFSSSECLKVDSPTRENPFLTSEENEASAQFLRDGYIVFPLENDSLLKAVKKNLYQAGIELVGNQSNWSEADFFDRFHKIISVSELNDFRVKLIARMAQDKSLRPNIYALGKKYIHWLVGNELAMQRNCNLSIQFPGDDSSLLPLHSDVWSGNSPYEIVFWLPLVNCYQTKSMFILPRPESEEVFRNFKQYSHLTAEALFNKITDKLVWLEVNCGQGVIFSHSLLHGNRVNEESETRWTFNVRFKSLLSPYGTKELGESFLPITMRPVTRIGYNYIKPEC
ncbi:sporadic carbohydrate cluster 2OG-Fe(II) oxygenase [Phormidium nigroviride]